jgi:hypothetical protein
VKREAPDNSKPTQPPSIRTMSDSSTPSSATTGAADKIPQVSETKPEAPATTSTGFAQLRSFAAGGFGGICAVVVGHPFDLVKVRLQTAEKGVYSGAFDVVRKSVGKDGLRRGLYAGVSAPLVGVTPMCKSSPFSLFFFFFFLRGGGENNQSVATIEISMGMTTVVVMFFLLFFF